MSLKLEFGKVVRSGELLKRYKTHFQSYRSNTCCFSLSPPHVSTLAYHCREGDRAASTAFLANTIRMKQIREQNPACHESEQEETTAVSSQCYLPHPPPTASRVLANGLRCSSRPYHEKEALIRLSAGKRHPSEPRKAPEAGKSCQPT